MKIGKSAFFTLLVIVFSIAVSGCAFNSKLMPTSKDMVSGLGSYDDIQAAYDKIVPNKTKVSDLKEMGLDPKKVPNITAFNYLELKNMFLANPSEKFENLPPEIQECVKARELCSGYRYGPYRGLYTKGQGNIFSRLAKCKKVDLTEGWELEFFLFRKGDVIVYKLPGRDLPKVHSVKEERRPLCFLQEMVDPNRLIPSPY